MDAVSLNASRTTASTTSSTDLPRFIFAPICSVSSPSASATAALSSTIGKAIDADDPTARNSNLLPVNANGDVRLRSVLSFSISGSRATPSLIMACDALADVLPAAIDSITRVSMEPMNTEMIAGGASLAPSRCSLPLDAMPALNSPA